MTPREAFDQAEGMMAELKRARISLGRNGVETAKHAGLEQSIVLKSEAGRSQPRLTTFIRWAEALDYEICLVRKPRQ